MGDSIPAIRALEPYRIDRDRAFFIWVFIALVSLAARVSGTGVAAFVLLPLVFTFTPLNVYRFLVLFLASAVFFFRPGLLSSGFWIFWAADGLAITFCFLLLFSRLQEPGEFRIPVSPTLLALYATSAYIVLLMGRSLGHTVLGYIALDLKAGLYFLLVPLLLMADGNKREPKKFFLLLGTFVLFASLHAAEVIGIFVGIGGRIATWNEIFLSDGVILSAILLRFPLSQKIMWYLRGALALCVIALLATQTRGLWLSTVAALAFFYASEFFRSKSFESGRFLKRILIFALVLTALNVAFTLLSGNSVLDFMGKRFSDSDPAELINPYSSTGYRLHESWAIWDQRTFFGHGTGATLRLFFTQLGKGEFMEWWSIHSGYFEILHKFGFAGLLIFFWMFGGYFLLARRISKSPSRVTSLFGSAIATVMLNHAIVSITSGWFLRHALVIWIPLFLIAERLRPRIRPNGNPS